MKSLISDIIVFNIVIVFLCDFIQKNSSLYYLANDFQILLILMIIDDNLVFKIIVLGQQGVGKSSMLMRYIKNQFSQQYNVTVGVQFASKQVQVNEKTTVRLQIWDTAGQQAFRAIVRSFYKGISGVFLCFAIDKEQSLQSLKNWIKQVRQNGHEEVMFFLVGTRLDLQNIRKVQTFKADQFLKQIGGYFYIQTSAKNNINIDIVIFLLFQII